MIITRILRILLGLAFLVIGVAKLTGTVNTVETFEAIGWGPVVPLLHRSARHHWSTADTDVEMDVLRSVVDDRHGRIGDGAVFDPAVRSMARAVVDVACRDSRLADAPSRQPPPASLA